MMKIEQRQNTEDTPKKGSLTNYHRRTLQVAQDVTQLSNNLYVLLKKEISVKNRESKVSFLIGQSKDILVRHGQASFSVIKMYSWQPVKEITLSTQ